MVEKKEKEGSEDSEKEESLKEELGDSLEEGKDKEEEDKKKSEKKEDSKEEVCEIFEVEKDGKEKIVEACGEEEVKKGTKKLINKENRILLGIIVVLALVLIGTLVGFLYGGKAREFEYKEIDFQVIKDDGGLIFYHTIIPTIKQGQSVNYNIYLRKDPRVIGEEVEFNGFVNIPKTVILNSNESFNCDGDGAIAIANFAQIMSFFEIQVLKHDNATCENTDGKYGFIKIQEGNETFIKQVGDMCYEFNVNNCEILDVTERFILDSLVKAKGRGVN